MSNAEVTREELIEALEDAVYQGCHAAPDGTLDSLYSSSWADGLRLLARLGKVTLDVDAGRRVIARRVEETG